MTPDYERQKQILSQLQSAGIPFVIVGGHAVAFHGYMRTTEDVDAVWLRSTDADAALLRVLEELERLPADGSAISSNGLC